MLKIREAKPRRAVKALCGNSSKPNETGRDSGDFYEQLRATTNNEKCEMFTTLLQVTRNYHKNEILEINEQLQTVKNERKLFLKVKIRD